MKKFKEGTYYGEIREVKSKKTASLDNEYIMTFVTDNPFLMDIGKEEALTLFQLTIKRMNK